MQKIFKKANQLTIGTEQLELKDISLANLSLTKTETQIIKSRLSGKSIGEYEETFHKHLCDEIMLSVAAITGCELPKSDIYADYLTSGLMDFFDDCGFLGYTVTEIILSVKLNVYPFALPAGMDIDRVESKNQRFNVEYLAGCLKNYAAIRKLLDRKILNHLKGF